MKTWGYSDKEHHEFHDSSSRDDMIGHLTTWHGEPEMMHGPWQTHVDHHTAEGWDSHDPGGNHQATDDMDQVARDLMAAADKLEKLAREFLEGRQGA